MKIAININELTLEQNTGVKVYTREIVKALERVDKENEYILYMDSPLKTKLSSEILELSSVFNGEFGKFKNFKLKSSKSRFSFWTYTKLPQEIKRDKPDILFMPIQAVPFFKKPKNLKIVVTVHDLAFLLFPDYFTRKDRFLLDFHTKRAVKMADKIIVPSEATKQVLLIPPLTPPKRGKIIGIPHLASPKRGGTLKGRGTVLPLLGGVRGGISKVFSFLGAGESKIPDEDKIKVIWHGVESRKYQVASVKQQNKQRNNPYILFVGSIQPRKNITGLIEAFEKVKNLPSPSIPPLTPPKRGRTVPPLLGEARWGILEGANKVLPLLGGARGGISDCKELQLVICGGRGWMADEIYERAGKSKFSGDIIFTGGVSDEERDELYKNALIFALPSFYEGFGLPVLEAMSFGVPCVVGDNSSLSEIAGDGALLVDANNSDDIAEKINLLLSDSELRKDLSRRGIENAKRFSWDKAAKETLEVFKEVVSSK